MPAVEISAVPRVRHDDGFWSLSCLRLADALISPIVHCKIFTKLSYLGIQHCWIFAEWRFLENYIASICAFFPEWAESENLHYKPTMPIFWNQQFCVKFTVFHVDKDRRKQCWFSECSRIVNTSNAVCLKVPDLPTPAMLFAWNASSARIIMMLFSDRQKFEGSSWAWAGPIHIRSRGFHGGGRMRSSLKLPKSARVPALLPSGYRR